MTRQKKKKPPQYVTRNKSMFSDLMVFLLTFFIVSATFLFVSVPKVVDKAPAPVVVSENKVVAPVVSEPARVSLTEAINPLVYENLRLWEVVHNLSWDYPKGVARAVAPQLGANVTYRTKIKELTPAQKEQLFPLIIKEGLQYKK